jgi:hypothetical protein
MLKKPNSRASREAVFGAGAQRLTQAGTKWTQTITEAAPRPCVYITKNTVSEMLGNAYNFIQLVNQDKEELLGHLGQTIASRA